MMHGREKSDSAVVAAKSANKDGHPSAEPMERRAGAEGNTVERGTSRTQGRGAVSSGLDRVRQAARTRKEARFTALLHHVDAELLRAAYGWLQRDAAAGVDGVSWEEYGHGLERRLADLKDRVHRGAYRAQPSRRVYIPKPDGRRRPLGIAALEDKIVQRAVVEVLNAIWEQDFLGFSYGFRPGRGQHDALDALAVGITERRVNFILDADIAGFFDAVSHEWLIRFVEHRVADRRIVRLIRKWLKVGVMEDGKVQPGWIGTPQGAVISPLLANIFLHYVFDLWAQQWRRRHARGDVILVRYADDIVAGFEHRAEAERFAAEMRDRMAAFGLALHPEKTRLIEFGRQAADGPAGARSRQAGDVQLPGLHPHLCGGPARPLPAPAQEPERPGARHAAEGQGSLAAPDARDDRRAGCLAAAGGDGLLRLSRRAHQRRRPLGLPLPPDGPLAAHTSLAKPEGCHHVATDDGAPRSLAAQPSHHASLAQPTLCRQIPEAGARCGKSARRDLCRGCLVTCIPTATGHEGHEGFRRCAPIILTLCPSCPSW
jgi:RNA-directed DNA polymerase